MSTPSPQSFGGVNPVLYLARLQAYADAMQTQSEELRQQLRDAAATAGNAHVEVTTLGGLVQEVRFTQAALGCSATVLRTAVREAYAEAVARSNNATANAVGSVAGPAAADGIRSSAPVAAQDAATALSLEHAEGEVRTGGEDDLDAQWERLDEFLESPELDEVDPWADPTTFLEGYDSVPHFDSTDWQGDLDREVARITAAAAELPERLAEVRASAESKLMRVSITGLGLLEDVVLLPGVQSIERPEDLDADFAELYQRACTDARQQLDAAFGESETGTPAWLDQLD